MADAEEPVLLTREGFERLEAELDQLRTVKRVEVAAAIHEAQEIGFAEPDGQWEDAKNQQAFVEGRILELERLLERAEIIDEDAAHASKEVRVGSMVRVKGPDGKVREYRLVGPAEADPTSGRISHESPVGHALIGKKRGDTFTVQTPGGTVEMKITAVK